MNSVLICKEFDQDYINALMIPNILWSWSCLQYRLGFFLEEMAHQVVIPSVILNFLAVMFAL